MASDFDKLETKINNWVHVVLNIILKNVRRQQCVFVRFPSASIFKALGWTKFNLGETSHNQPSILIYETISCKSFTRICYRQIRQLEMLLELLATITSTKHLRLSPIKKWIRCVRQHWFTGLLTVIFTIAFEIKVGGNSRRIADEPTAVVFYHPS